MELSKAISQSIESVRKDSWNLATSGKIMSKFWFNELLTEISSFQGAIQKTINAGMLEENPRLHAILKGLDIELQAILKNGKLLSEMDLENFAPYLTDEEQQLNVHLSRLSVKCNYLVDHLRDLMSEGELARLGDEFIFERQTLAEKAHAMAMGW